MLTSAPSSHAHKGQRLVSKRFNSYVCIFIFSFSNILTYCDLYIEQFDLCTSLLAVDTRKGVFTVDIREPCTGFAEGVSTHKYLDDNFKQSLR